MKKLTNLERLVLKALHGGKNIDQTWNQVLQVKDFGSLPHSINRAIPQIFNSLRGQNQALEYQRLAGFTKRNWVENIGRLNYVLPILESANRAGVRVVVLKGMAISFLRNDFASRVMGDADLLIHKSDEEAFGKIIEELGFSATYQRNCPHGKSKAHTLTDEFLDKYGNAIDIHSTADTDSLFKILWEESISVNYEGLAVNIPSPVNLMLHSLSHGFDGVAQSDLMQTGLDFLMLQDRLEISDFASKASVLGFSSELQEFLAFFELEDESKLVKSSVRRRSLIKEFVNLSRIRHQREINFKVAYRASKNKNLHQISYFFWILLGATRPLEEFWISRKGGFVKRFIEISDSNGLTKIKDYIPAELKSADRYEIRFGLKKGFKSLCIDTQGLVFAPHQIYINGKLNQKIQSNSKLVANLSGSKNGQYEISIRQPYGRCQKCTEILVEAAIISNSSKNLLGHPVR